MKDVYKTKLKCECTGRFLNAMNITCLHARSCPVRHYQIKYGLNEIMQMRGRIKYRLRNE